MVNTVMLKSFLLKNILFILLALIVVFNFACSQENIVTGLHTPIPSITPTSKLNTSSDLNDIRNIDKESIGSGTITLVSRLEVITDLIAAYSAVSGDITQGELQDIEQRVGELQFEKRLVQTLLSALNYIHEYESTVDEPRADYKFFQSQLKGAYAEAEFFHPQPGDVEPCFQRIIDCSLPPQANLVKEPEDHYDTDAWITAALHLAPDETPDWFREDVIEAENLVGYKLTHQFFTLLLQRKCWPGYDFGIEHNQRLDELAILIAEEEDDVEPTMLDLYSERAAMLIAGGYGTLVRREWIEQICENQLPNSLWPNSRNAAVYDMHSTYNALWAIAGYQVLLQRDEQSRRELFPFLSKE